jgi:hypothetical protein
LSSNYASEAGHWYGRDGRPAYEVVGKNGNLRPTTLRDARKLDLVPSVTTIMACAAAPALESWKRNQILMSALTLPRIDGEESEEFSKRVIRDSQEQAKQAAERGSLIHGCIENHLLEEPYDQAHRDCVMGALDCLDGWCGLSDIRPERSFYHQFGFGGKCDVHKRADPFPGFVADFKTKDFGPGELPLAWDNHSMQLAAYREGFGMPKARGAIIYISTQVAGLTHLVEVSQDELQKGWRMFCALLTYWKAKNSWIEPETE